MSSQDAKCAGYIHKRARAIQFAVEDETYAEIFNLISCFVLKFYEPICRYFSFHVGKHNSVNGGPRRNKTNRGIVNTLKFTLMRVPRNRPFIQDHARRSSLCPKMTAPAGSSILLPMRDRQEYSPILKNLGRHARAMKCPPMELIEEHHLDYHNALFRFFANRVSKNGRVAAMKLTPLHFLVE